MQRVWIFYMMALNSIKLSLKIEHIVFKLLLGAEDGVAVQTALTQRFVAVEKCTVEHIRDIEEDQVVGQR